MNDEAVGEARGSGVKVGRGRVAEVQVNAAGVAPNRRATRRRLAMGKLLVNNKLRWINVSLAKS